MKLVQLPFPGGSPGKDIAEALRPALADLMKAHMADRSRETATALVQWALDHGFTPSLKFRLLHSIWRLDVAGMSSLREICTHPAYEAIIGMGEEALPFIFSELERGPGHWHVALHRITGAQPVPVDQAGRMSAIRDCWLQWRKDNE